MEENRCPLDFPRWRIAANGPLHAPVARDGKTVELLVDYSVEKVPKKRKKDPKCRIWNPELF